MVGRHIGWLFPQVQFLSKMKTTCYLFPSFLTLSLSPPPESNSAATEPFSSPIYLNFYKPITSISRFSTIQEFLCDFIYISSTHEDPLNQALYQDPRTFIELKTNGVDYIELLMQQLGLSDCRDEEQEGVGLELLWSWVYANIVKVKGPKCGKEIEDERKEPLRLAHLLLAKAALLSEKKWWVRTWSFEFPSTVR